MSRFIDLLDAALEAAESKNQAKENFFVALATKEPEATTEAVNVWFQAWNGSERWQLLARSIKLEVTQKLALRESLSF